MTAAPSAPIIKHALEVQTCQVCGEQKPLSEQFWLKVALGGWFPICLSCTNRRTRRLDYKRYGKISGQARPPRQDMRHYTSYFSVEGDFDDR